MSISRTRLQELERELSSVPAYPRPRTLYWSVIAILLVAFGASYSMLLRAGASTFEITMLTAVSYLIASILAISVGHQAFHGSLFTSKRVNAWVGSIFFIPLGVDGTLWRNRHLRDHHPKPNTQGHDLDLDNPFFFRLAPYTEHRWYHQFQHVYAPFLYSVGTFITIFIDDVRSLFVECSRGAQPRARGLALGFVARKFAFVGIWFLVPVMFNPDITLGEMLLAFSLSTIPTGWLFLPIAAAHLNEHATFFSADEKMPFAETQEETSIEFCAESKLMTIVYGGLNCHLAHHLWPRVSGCHYQKLYGLYAEVGGELPPNLSIGALLASHFRFLRNMGQLVRN